MTDLNRSDLQLCLYRLQVVEQQPESPRKRATIAGILARIETLTQAVPAEVINPWYGKKAA